LEGETLRAGNQGGDSCAHSPASANHVVAVGAVDEADTRPWFSNYGACNDIFAPGVNIRAAAWSGAAAVPTTGAGATTTTGGKQSVEAAAGAADAAMSKQSEAAVVGAAGATGAAGAMGGVDGAGGEDGAGAGDDGSTGDDAATADDAGGGGGGGGGDGDESGGGGGGGGGEAAPLGGGGGDGGGGVVLHNNTTRLGHGTSVAAPFVAGAAAVFLSHVPDAGADDVHAALVAGAARDKVRDPGEGSPNLLLNVRGVEAQAKECRRNLDAAETLADGAVETVSAAAAAVTTARKTCTFGAWSAWTPHVISQSKHQLMTAGIFYVTNLSYPSSCPSREARCAGATQRRTREVSAAPPCGRALCTLLPEATEEVVCPCGMAPPPPPPPPPPAPVKRRPAVIVSLPPGGDADDDEEVPRVEAFGGAADPAPPAAAAATAGQSYHYGRRAFGGSF
jgi:hypothetical protein